jgi:hypothetical protein
MIQEKAKACQRFSPFGTRSSGKARRTWPSRVNDPACADL